MHRRTLLTLPALLTLPSPAPVRAAACPGVGELRVGGGAALAGRMQRRLGMPVRAMGGDRLAALNAGHLELALLTAAELRRARRLMGARLVVLGARGSGTVAVTRRVLAPALRDALDVAAG